MKVLQLLSTKRGLYNKSGSPNGGLEAVLINLHEAFVEAKWDAFYSDSIESSKSDATIRYDLSSYRNYSIYASHIRDWIEREKPDLVIVHGANTLLDYLTRMGVRVLFVEHSMAYSINLNSYGKFFSNTAPEARKIGSKIITVSPITMETKKKAIADFGVDFEFDGWCRFQFPTHELLSLPVVKSENYCVTIARCERKKSIERMLRHCTRNNIDWRLITYIPNEASQLWFTEQLAMYDQNKMYIGIDRPTTINVLSRGAILGSSSQHESAGVTAFEGLMFGLPLLLNEPRGQNGKHASRMFLPDDNFVATLYSEPEKIEKLMSLTIQERKNLRDMAVAYNGVEEVLKNLKQYASEIGKPMPQSQSFLEQLLSA